MTYQTRRMSRCACAAVLLWAGSGCITGKVLDPATGHGIAGTTVLTYARCSGEGCTTQGEGWQSTTTASDGGEFLYDAYGDSRAYLQPASDPNASACERSPDYETFEMQISAPGFVSRTVYHKPDYKPYTDPDTGATVTDPATGNPKLFSGLPRPVYLCPEGAPDSDDDTICDEVEAKYGTDPMKADTDQDGLDDAFELFGYEHLDLAGYGADPLHRDVFVEVDYYPGQGVEQDIFQEAVGAFAAAPLHNPDQRDGIALHVVVDDEIAPAYADPNIVIPLWIDWAEFDMIKRCYFQPYRSAAFHYAVFANQLNGDSGGQSRFIPGHDLVIAVPEVSARQKAATLMHELGHNLGLNHGGPTLDAAAWKPNYLSIMSYQYAYTGVIRNGSWVFDYSRHPVAQVRESALSERDAMSPGDSSVSEDILNQYRVVIGVDDDGDWQTPLVSMCVRGTAGANLDWNGPRSYADPYSEHPCAEAFAEPEAGQVQADLNANGTKTDVFPASQNDWDVLWYWGNGYDGGAIGVPRPGVVEALADNAVTPEACPPPPSH
jgi:hypothetical protein